MIRIQDLVKTFGPQSILRGASLEIARGEVAVMIGASGSGKSTLLRCINGLESFDGGSIEINGRPVPACEQAALGTADWCRLRRGVGMVFQQFNLFPHMSVLENVMCGPRFVLKMPRAAAAERARKLLDRVGLAHRLNHRPAQLSGGQQQRVAIARTLANEPEVILFDEPTSALDPKMTAEVLAVMADLAADGQTMLVVSHAMGFVRRSASQVHVLSQGRVIESGPPQRVFEAPQNPETREFLAEAEI